jgi:hypothetical protein
VRRVHGIIQRIAAHFEQIPLLLGSCTRLGIAAMSMGQVSAASGLHRQLAISSMATYEAGLEIA